MGAALGGVLGGGMASLGQAHEDAGEDAHEGGVAFFGGEVERSGAVARACWHVGAS